MCEVTLMILFQELKKAALVFASILLLTMSVNYSDGLSPYEHKGKCGMPEVKYHFSVKNMNDLFE